jgi:ubiquinone/menaquinone biosynthesis C-methylase UbiE
MDISDTFLDFAKTVKGLTCLKGDMIDIPLKDKSIDLIYCSSVIEHSPDIQKTISEMSRVSSQFYITMFKWRMNNGDLMSYYNPEKHYYSTCFNIDMLLNLVTQYGEIKKLVVHGIEEGEEDFNKYRYTLNKNIDRHRNGKYLSISGYWRDK